VCVGTSGVLLTRFLLGVLGGCGMGGDMVDGCFLFLEDLLVCTEGCVRLGVVGSAEACVRLGVVGSAEGCVRLGVVGCAGLRGSRQLLSCVKMPVHVRAHEHKREEGAVVRRIG
jgi:hypothetical protein